MFSKYQVFFLPVIAGLTLLITGCPQGHSAKNRSMENIKGWWIASSVTPRGGSRVKLVRNDESILFGFNENFKFYLLDGSLPNCQGVANNYRWEASRIQVSAGAGCTAKDIKIGPATFDGQGTTTEIELENVNLTDTLIFDHVHLKSITADMAMELYHKDFVPNREKISRSGGEMFPATSPPITFDQRSRTYPDALVNNNLVGYWIFDSISFGGRIYRPGDTIDNPETGEKISLRRDKTILHMKSDELKMYDEREALSPEYLRCEIENDQIVQGNLRTQVKTLDFKRGEMRTGPGMLSLGLKLDKNDALIFRLITREQALREIPHNASFRLDQLTVIEMFGLSGKSSN